MLHTNQILVLAPHTTMVNWVVVVLFPNTSLPEKK
jgi:hypothetical protein